MDQTQNIEHVKVITENQPIIDNIQTPILTVEDEDTKCAMKTEDEIIKHEEVNIENRPVINDMAIVKYEGIKCPVTVEDGNINREELIDDIQTVKEEISPVNDKEAENSNYEIEEIKNLPKIDTLNINTVLKFSDVTDFKSGIKTGILELSVSSCNNTEKQLFNFPIKSIKELDLFERQLLDGNFYCMMVNYLARLENPNIAVMTNNVMAKLFHNDVLPYVLCYAGDKNKDGFSVITNSCSLVFDTIKHIPKHENCINVQIGSSLLYFITTELCNGENQQENSGDISDEE